MGYFVHLLVMYKLVWYNYNDVGSCGLSCGVEFVSDQ